MYRAWDVLIHLPQGRKVLKRFRAEFWNLVHAGNPVAQQLVPERVLEARGATRDAGNNPRRYPNFIRCAAGEFWMGASVDERPRHRVSVSGFLVQTTPVTVAQYRLFDRQHQAPWSDDCPVTEVTWYDAWAFARWIGGRLPTEAQWEYACRAGTETIYSFGNQAKKLGEYAWYGENSEGQAHPVATKKPNPWGLYDMHGNVWEWCHDWYDGSYYESSPHDDPLGPTGGSYRVYRGGSWRRVASCCRASCRYGYGPGDRDDGLGFRLARQFPSSSKEVLSAVAVRPRSLERRPRGRKGR
jgi:formylglycine-generating enzyme required for sulfatase activity